MEIGYVYHVPYATPAVLIALMAIQGAIKTSEALKKLDALVANISDDEYAIVKLFLESRRPQ